MGHANRGKGLEFEREAVATRPSPGWDRRRSFRVAVPASASLWHKGELRGSYAVCDVSIGGCSLVGGPVRPVGEEVDLMLHLPHRPPLALHARVRRSDERSLGLSFEKATPRAEDCIQDVVVETFARTHDHRRHVALVIEPRPVVRQALVGTLRELGQHAIGVSTALDAVQLLVQEGERMDSVFIEAECASLPSIEFVEFLACNHPHVRRVLVGDADRIQASWAAEASGEVHALLETPCDRQTLRRVLSRIGCTPIDSVLS